MSLCPRSSRQFNLISAILLFTVGALLPRCTAAQAGSPAASASQPGSAPAPASPAQTPALTQADIDKLKQEAQTAKDAAAAAQKKADDAQKAADNAKSSADAAATAQSKSEAAQGKAETAKTGAETAQGKAETAKTGAETAKTGAETAQGKAETAKAGAGESASMANDLTKTANQSALNALAAAGVAWNGSTNVKDNVRIQAVLLPHPSASRVFGKEIASHYAVIQVIVDNQSEDSSFLLQSVFMDYSDWALSGIINSADDSAPTDNQTAPTKTDCHAARPPDSSQVASCPGQVASVEYRIIRGQLQDASVWSGRNTIVRIAVFAGSVSTGLAGLKSKAALGYSSSYSGDFIPALQILWPDPTVAQVNRVSDLGFQTNKAFPKGSADVVYAFFPIERFLSPGLKHLFLNAPALFFSPAQLFFDTKIDHKALAKSGISKKDVDDTKAVIKELLRVGDTVHGDPHTPTDAQVLARLIGRCPNFQDETNQSCRYKNIFSSISLNKIHVVAGGVMSVNTQTIPSNIASIDFALGNNTPDLWTKTGVNQSGSVNGRFLTGSSLTVSSMTIAGVAADPKNYFTTLPFPSVSTGATDSLLPFTMNLKKPIDRGAILQFTVLKDPSGTTDKTASKVKSMDYGFTVSY